MYDRNTSSRPLGTLSPTSPRHLKQKTADSNNNHKQFKSQEANQARPTLHTQHTHARTHARTHAHRNARTSHEIHTYISKKKSRTCIRKTATEGYVLIFQYRFCSFYFFVKVHDMLKKIKKIKNKINKISKLTKLSAYLMSCQLWGCKIQKAGVGGRGGR